MDKNLKPKINTEMPVTFSVAQVVPERFPKKEAPKVPLCSKGKLISKGDLPENFLYNSSGFVRTCINAYNAHYHLIIRPDDVWVAMLNIIQIYINNNAEKLRGKFVNHDGKKELEVKAFGNRFTADYKMFCREITTQILGNLKDKKDGEWFLPSFSTTTDVDKLVCSGMLMASMKEYFGYKLTLMCGLPKVTLLGEVKDWESLYGKIERIPSFDVGDGQMKAWVKMLDPVLQQFVLSAKGSPDKDWWNRICSHLTGGSGPHYLSGWITVFSPFTDEGKWIGDVKSVQENFGSKMITSEWPIIESGDICNSVAKVPVTIDDNGLKVETELFIGHLGYTFTNHKNMFGSDKECSLQPYIGWELNEKEAPKKKKGLFDEDAFDFH